METITVFKDAVTIAKLDEDRNLVFGWASVATDKEGRAVIDKEGDIIESSDLEDAAYDFVLNFREANETPHGSEEVVGHLVESMVFTPEKLEKLGLPEGSLPTAWWTGFRLNDATFAKVKEGRYGAFSIEGSAKRVAA